MNPASYLDKIYKMYRDENSYMRVIGFIDRPALILQEPITGRQEVVVIGSPLHEGLDEISEADALQAMEIKLRLSTPPRD